MGKVNPGVVVGGAMLLGMVFAGCLVLAVDHSGASRRQFMANCATVRGADDAALRACAADWPRFNAAKQHGWRVP